MTFESTTSDADPGAGKIAFNNGTLSSVSILYIDDADDAGADISGYVQSFDDVSNSTARGIITVTKEGTASTFALFKVSGAVTDASGYTKVPVTHVVSNGTFSDNDGVGVHFSYSGADGQDGSGSMSNFTLAGDSGSNQTIADGNTLTVTGGEGIDTAASATDTITISGEDASTSNKGVASFASANFDVSSGAVSIKNGGVDNDELAGSIASAKLVATLSEKTLDSCTLTKHTQETATISATAATGTINYDLKTQSILYYTSDATGNFTVNFRGDGSTTLNSIMDTGDVVTAVFLVTNGSSAKYNNAFQVDGSSITPKNQGGSSYSSGNANSIDVYTYSIIKTGDAAFTMLTSQTQFA
jgi:hypothetical protein